MLHQPVARLPRVGPASDNPWAVANRGNDFARRRCRLNEADRVGIAAQRVETADAARNNHDIIVLRRDVLQMPIKPDPAAGCDKVDCQDMRFPHGGNLEAQVIRIVGLLGRDQVNWAPRDRK